jgi:hypothetical protein
MIKQVTLQTFTIHRIVYSSSTSLYPVSKSFLQTEAHGQSYLRGELESLGLYSMQLNKFNDNDELCSLMKSIKESLLQQYDQAYKEHSRR